MTEDLLAQLAQLQKHTRRLQAAVDAMRARFQPREGRGTDPSGCVTVVIDPDGVPSRIEVSSEWQRYVAAEELGSCVLFAYQQAVAEATRAWSESLDREVWWQSQADAAEAGTWDDTPPSPLAQVQCVPRWQVAFAELVHLQRRDGEGRGRGLVARAQLAHCRVAWLCFGAFPSAAADR